MLQTLEHPRRTVLAAAQPAAGAGFTVKVPGSERQLLQAVSFTLVTSAVVATRTPVLTINDGAGVALAACIGGFGVTASDNLRYTFAYGLSEWDGVTLIGASGPGPLLPLSDGDQIALTIANEDAGDQTSNIRVTLLQWPYRDDEDQ